MNRRRAAPAVIIALFFLVFAGGGAFQVFLKAALPQDWSALRVTSLLAVVYFSFMIWRLLIPASQRLLTDKWSLVSAAAAYALVPVVLRFTVDYRCLVIAAALWGWGAAGLWQTGPVWLYDLTNPRRRGLWAGVLYGAVFLALIGGAKVQGWAAEAGRPQLLNAALPPAALAVALALFLPRRRARAEPLSLRGITDLVFDRRVLLVGGLLFASAMAYGLLLGAFRDNIELSFGSSALGTILAVYFGARLALSVAGGFFSDILRRGTVMTAAYLAGGVSLLWAASSQGAAAMAVSAGCLGLVSGVVPVSVTACTGDWFEPSRRSLALGAAFVWRDLGMVVSLLAGQYLARFSGGFRVPLLAFGALFVVCGFASLAVPSGDVRRDAEK